MKVLFIFTLFLISAGGGESKRVMGYLGGGVLIKCRYETQYTSNPKYLCEGPWPCMTKPIWTDAKNEWINSGRFSLFDDTRASQFWVMIRELTVEDSGTYKCGVWKSGIDVYTPVELKVEEDLSYENSISVVGRVGGNVNISCKYPQSHSNDPKFLCKRVGTADCNYKTSVKFNKSWIDNGKNSLFDDGKQIFTVIINSLTEGDSGEYWCGAESDWTSDHGYKVYITQINLRVTVQELPATLSSLSPSSTTPQSTESNLSSRANTTGKSSLRTNTSTAIPASSVITVCVILVLLLIGLFIFILRKRLRPQDPARASTQPLRSSSSNYMVSLKDTRRLPGSDTGVSTVYSTAHLPTNPPEPSQTVYDNVQLFTNPSEPSQTIYDNVQHLGNSMHGGGQLLIQQIRNHRLEEGDGEEGEKILSRPSKSLNPTPQKLLEQLHDKA
ncbi:polymeric immunoglobulin receptor-like [Pygocentrus nattereri]|uniref:polymeric immunoglobulin receptor-like n=1 Tax=Pygocentrus nattereri TaxID=42514 RepID=UPI0018915319|nr:polymeric immunoglobulin receptor-like [Pygocentrus nattereri]